MYPEILNRPQLGDDLENAIFFIPWGHNKVIIDKCKGDSAKALFYVKKTLENNWSRDVLLNFLDTDLYERQGKAVTNFALTFASLSFTKLFGTSTTKRRTKRLSNKISFGILHDTSVKSSLSNFKTKEGVR